MKKLFSLLVVATMLLISIAACTPKAETPVVEEPEKTDVVAEPEETEVVEETEEEETAVVEVPFEERGYKIAYIRNGAASDIFKMAVDAATAEAEKLGMTLDFFMSQGDDVVFQDIVNQCIGQDYDGLYLSHGKSAYAFDLVSRAVEAGKFVVTFDTVIEDADGKGIPGVTQMFQNDFLMAELSLDYIINELYPDTRPVRLLKLWRGPGIPPFDRRQETYKEYEDQGLIETLEILGPSDPANSEGSINTVVASVLPAYPEGTVDAIWSAYDAYGRGAYKALVEAGRTDIPLVTIDISNQDINYMLEDPDRFKACVAVHFENVGIQGVRLLAKKFYGEETPDLYNLAPSIVRAEDLKEGANVLNLHEIVPGYGVVDDHWETWMEEIVQNN